MEVIVKLCWGLLAQAAHDAGFSGSAHLSSTFKDMFGLRPSDLLTAGVEIRPED